MNLAEGFGILNEASSFAALKFMIFEAAAAYLKSRGIEPDLNTLRRITQRINVAQLRKLRATAPDRAAFEVQTKRIVAAVLHEYSWTTNTSL